MAWAKNDYISTDVADYNDLNAIGNSIRSWEGNVNAGGYDLSGLGVLTFHSAGYIAGNAGFGASNAATRIHAYGLGQGVAAYTYTDGGSHAATIYAQSSDGSSGSGGALLLGSGNGAFGYIKGWLEGGTRTGAITFGTNPDNGSTLYERMRITSNGLVGIGTVTPDALLDVEVASGSTRALTCTSAGSGVFDCTAILQNNNAAAVVSAGILRVTAANNDNNNALIAATTPDQTRFFVMASGLTQISANGHGSSSATSLVVTDGTYSTFNMVHANSPYSNSLIYKVFGSATHVFEVNTGYGLAIEHTSKNVVVMGGTLVVKGSGVEGGEMQLFDHDALGSWVVDVDAAKNLRIFRSGTADIMFQIDNGTGAIKMRLGGSLKTLSLSGSNVIAT